MAIAIYPLMFFVVGILLHALVTHATVKEAGRALMWSGLFALAFELGQRALQFG